MGHYTGKFMFVKNAVAAAGAAVLFAAMPVAAQSGKAPPADIGLVPANVLLAEHSNWFTPAKIYDLAKEHWPLPSYPAGLGYEAYSAVGFDLANTILIKGPARDAKGNRELIVIDTLGNPEIAHRTIQAFRAQGILPICPDFALGQPVPEACKLPLRAIIYTHNHIDHTFGVWGFLGAADRPPCAVADPQIAGADTLLDTAVENRDCVAVIGQYKINDGVATTALSTGTIIDARSSYMYGAFIPRNHVNSGIGPQELIAFVEVDGKKVAVSGSYRMPSRTFDNELKVIAAGVQMQLIYVPSETNDELAVFLPDRRNRTGAPPTDADWSGPGLLQSAEVIQGPSFPNLYSLRGTAYRDPANWFRSVDRLRQFDSWCMLPSHGPPLCEAGNIQRLLRNFRDAIQFTHDQTLRWMNKGYTMNELAPLIEDMYLTAGQHGHLMSELDQVRPIKNETVPSNRCPDGGTPVVPPHQAVPPARDCVNPRDYLRPFYGSVVQAVREIYVGSVGWFEADPVALRPVPPRRRAESTVALICVPRPGGNGAMICGAEAVNIAAADALAKADRHKQAGEMDEAVAQYQWAAELATLVVRAYTQLVPTDAIAEPHALKPARQIKARAFLGLAEPELNPNWRNFYITAAHELRGLPLPSDIKGGLVAPGVISALPAGSWVNSLTLRLRAEVTAREAVNESFGFWFPAEGNQGFGAQGYRLQVRHGVAEFIEQTPHGAPLGQSDVATSDYGISMTKPALDALLLAEMRGADEFAKVWAELVRGGQIQCLRNGGTACIDDFAKHFQQYFDPKPTGLPPLADR
jgi:alkyl sulfatase BDS1-like metallo-beta-lactamase superfamily hydrolase